MPLKRAFLMAGTSLKWKDLLSEGGFFGDLDGKESACKAGDPSSIPGWGRSPKGMATHSSILVQRGPWTEDPGGHYVKGKVVVNEPAGWLFWTPPAPAHHLMAKQLLLFLSIATLHLVSFPPSRAVLVIQNPIDQAESLVCSRKRNMMPRILCAKYLSRNEGFLVPKYRINEAKIWKMTRQEQEFWNQIDSSSLNLALLLTFYMTMGVIYVIQYLWGWLSYQIDIILSYRLIKIKWGDRFLGAKIVRDFSIWDNIRRLLLTLLKEIKECLYKWKESCVHRLEDLMLLR